MADQLAIAKEKTMKRDAPWLIRTYSGYASAKESNALYRKNLGRGQTGLSIAFDLPTQTGYDSDHVLAKGEVGKVGVPVCHVGDMDTLLDGIPLDRMNTSMTINAPAAWLLSLYVADRRAARHPARRALRHHPERHHQGIPVARHLHLSAGAVDAADLRRDRLHLQGSAQVEPDQRLLLPPAGGGSDTGAGAGVRAGHRHRRARRGEGLRPGAGRRLRAGGRPYQLLLQRRHQVRHRVVQDAGVHSPVGRDLPGALRRRGREAAPLPLRRAGQFARAHRAAAGEQRLPHPARDAGRRAVEGRARPRRAASGVERGARPAQAVGPAVVAQAAADRRLRDRPARLRRHLRRLAGNRREGGAARVPGARGARQDRGDGRRRRRRRVRAT